MKQIQFCQLCFFYFTYIFENDIIMFHSYQFENLYFQHIILIKNTHICELRRALRGKWDVVEINTI